MKQQPQGYYIGYSCNSGERHKASSGGIGTLIIRHLLTTPDYGTAMTFVFDKSQCAFVPKLIYRFDEYNNVGSIYQDTDNVGFVRDNIDKIKDGIVVTCMPCQVNAIRTLLNRHHIKSFIISFCCSGQTVVEGTWLYYKFLGINKNEVTNLQYRGNGWPSGIQITLADGTKIYHNNWTKPWSTIHLSEFYRPRRCLKCKLDTSYTADISLADPWLKQYLAEEKEGQTLFLINTNEGNKVMTEMQELGLCHFTTTTYQNYYDAQRPNVEKANRIKNRQIGAKIIYSLMGKEWYRNYFIQTQKRMEFHNRMKHRLLAFPWSKLFGASLYHRFLNYLRYRFYAIQLGSHDGRFNISGGIILNNPQCIHLGRNVGIGANTFFGPVTDYQGEHYNPVIEIGCGTWVGKNCSIAAIQKVKIGSNVLFAGRVHITDHSHGYEDIDRPIAPQKLITKGPVVIDDDCWLGFSCEILSGVHIGKHSVVAARAVVTKDVPAYSIVAGNPARVIKQYNFETKKWERIQNHIS